MANKTAITPTRSEDYAAWYQAVIKAADMAEHSPVRGCMVIKPWGYAVWERIQSLMDKTLKRRGVSNFYCPLFIPLSYFQKEAEQVEGFATECAVVTHHQLRKNSDGELQPAGELEEPLIVRPTSETIIGEMVSRWVQSYRDLPMKLNQWANVVRWEMRTRLFLRSSEFLWQEGHTAHATEDEALAEAREMANVYADFAENNMAIPVIRGEKSRNERFPGAVNSFTMEAMMQDGKALQAGTSHFLGQNFSRAFDITYTDKDEQRKLTWTTSWGTSTRLIGALIMAHADDDGLVLPPIIAPTQVVILPLLKNNQDNSALLDYCEALADRLRAHSFAGEEIRVHIDMRDQRPGEKAWSWVKKGVPIRCEIGAKELQNNAVYMGLRHKAYRDKTAVSHDEFIADIAKTLQDIQDAIHKKAQDFRDANLQHCDTQAALTDFFSNGIGFATAYWHDHADNDTIEKQLKTDHNVTVRCLLDNNNTGPCIFSGKTGRLAVFAKAY